jgi:uncharacterized protein YjbI with pentapeptide repeats
MMKTKMLLAGLACVMMATSAQAGEKKHLGHTPYRQGLQPRSVDPCIDEPQPHVNWRKCEMPGVSLGAASLQGANMSSMNLKKAYLRYANLTNAKLDGADLEGVNLTGMKLDGAIVSPATVWTSGKFCRGSTVDTCR